MFYLAQKLVIPVLCHNSASAEKRLLHCLDVHWTLFRAHLFSSEAMFVKFSFSGRAGKPSVYILSQCLCLAFVPEF